MSFLNFGLDRFPTTRIVNTEGAIGLWVGRNNLWRSRLFAGSYTWTSADGVERRLRDLETRHLCNLINYLTTVSRRFDKPNAITKSPLFLALVAERHRRKVKTSPDMMAMVRALQERTGVGYRDALKALMVCEGDLEEALTMIRRSGT